MTLQEVGQVILALQNKEIMQAVVTAINEADAAGRQIAALQERLAKSAEREATLREEIETLKKDHAAYIERMGRDAATQYKALEEAHAERTKRAREEMAVATGRIVERERQIRELEKKVSEMSEHPDVKAARAAKIKGEMETLAAQLKVLEPPPPPPPPPAPVIEAPEPELLPQEPEEELEKPSVRKKGFRTL